MLNQDFSLNRILSNSVVLVIVVMVIMAWLALFSVILTG